MKSSDNDALRLKVIQDVMELDDDNLRKLHEVMTLVSNKHNPVLFDLLHSSVEELEENLPTYATKEVIDEIDSEMGWKKFGQKGLHSFLFNKNISIHNH